MCARIVCQMLISINLLVTDTPPCVYASRLELWKLSFHAFGEFRAVLSVKRNYASLFLTLFWTLLWTFPLVILILYSVSELCANVCSREICRSICVVMGSSTAFDSFFYCPDEIHRVV